ncbi:MAG: hypothetical protein A3F17_07170 [Gammaproteobacteria bacterium RIFCSPHIGHO2_12_FULL_41_15]|nr:MAG: hypothetical protein A3F17_07170 [Gammaproteobacteria bacterium RIFCSPHIGHO2_12_FULL_41_15]
MMLVDLARNDISTIYEPGSVKVKNLLRVKHFSHVSHLTSVVVGKLRKNGMATVQAGAGIVS